MKIQDGLLSVKDPEVIILTEMHGRISLPERCSLGRELRVQADFGAQLGFHICTWLLGGSLLFHCPRLSLGSESLWGFTAAEVAVFSPVCACAAR